MADELLVLSTIVLCHMSAGTNTPALSVVRFVSRWARERILSWTLEQISSC
jgi:hypothetical protein